MLALSLLAQAIAGVLAFALLLAKVHGVIFGFGVRTQLDLLFRQQALMARQIDEIHPVIAKEPPMARESFEQLKSAVERAGALKEAALELLRHMGDWLQQMADALAQTLREHADALADGISEHED